MRVKYIDERWPDLRVFGKTTDGLEFVTDVNEAIDVPMSPEHAVIVVNHYNKLKQEFTDLIQAFDKADSKAFEEFWYNRDLNQ